MFGSQALEIAIGIVFVYLLLSVVSSVVNEWVAGIMGTRSNNLLAGIRNLLNDPDGKGLARQLYDHPVIKGLARRGGKPSYVPSRLFALALMDIVAPSDPGAPPKAFTEVRDAVATLQDSHMRTVLLTFLDEAGNDLKKARENVENWFNDAMDRVSGWYKRRAQAFVLCWALLVTVLVNADTIMIANSLSRDATMRASIVAAAQETAKQPLPTGSESPVTRIEQLRKELQQLELPVGWSQVAGDPRRLPAGLQGWVMKVLGLLFTAIAVSLGAPFWFDMLNKLVNLRSAGKQPEKTPKA